ncbi:MAG: tRNA nucleotidyltransferase (CCA-adding enzyme) [Candidatus Paceibacteria bacterium]|jgi:tRNA nucleotidyltransferase (CCA-adding enzyme)
MRTMHFNIPNEVVKVTQTLEKGGFEAYLVGGCVRDLLTERKPKDWDITTNAKPDQIQDLFEKTVYENNFGTVAVVNEGLEQDDPVRIIEITPYRTETTYSNNRHPDSVDFSDKLEDDLKRRDFTMNAIALEIKGSSVNDIDDEMYKRHEVSITDIYGGIKDIQEQRIRAVGNADERFKEDALRIMRAIRFSSQLGFMTDPGVLEAMDKNSGLLANISEERIRDELVKIINSDSPMIAFITMQKLGLLAYVVPELEEMVKVEQGGEHIYDVWEHSLRALQNGADKNNPFHVRIAALFHDIGKPRTRKPDPKGNGWTFYAHEVIGARMTKKIMDKLHFSRETTKTVVSLVRWHMFFSDPDQITLSAVRRLIRNVGPELVWDLMDVRRCDRIGMGRPKESPYRLRKFESMIDEVSRDPVSVKQLKLNGDIMLAELGMKPGREIGWILHALLEEVLDDPQKNDLEHQKERAQKLLKLKPEELKKLGEAGKDATEEAEEAELKEIRKKHRVGK